MTIREPVRRLKKRKLTIELGLVRIAGGRVTYVEIA
jgi:hypothetical protein